MTVSEVVDGERRSRRFGRFDRIAAVAGGLVEAALAVEAGFSVAGRTLLALSAAFLFALAWVMQFRPAILRGRRGIVAAALGIALMGAAASVVAAGVPPDRPHMPTIKRADAHEGRMWAISSCGAYARSVLARAVLPRTASHSERDKASKTAAAWRAESASDANRAASFDKRWQSLYLAAWRVNERWRGNAAVSDKAYRGAVTAIGELCQPLTYGGS